MQIAALRLRTLTDGAQSARGLEALAVAHLALGSTTLAVAALDEAVTVAPSDLAARTALSAALIERWRESARPADLVRALDETGVVLARAPQSGPALFNRALALEKLGLTRQASRMWEVCRRAETNTAWSQEVTERRDGVNAPVRPVQFPALDAGDAIFESTVSTSSVTVYRYVENEVLPDWTHATLGRTTRPAASEATGGPSLDLASRLAEALRRTGRDSYARMLLDRMRASRSWTPARRRELALGVDGLSQWRALIDAGGYAEAAPLAAKARAALARAGVDTIEADFDIGYSDFVGGRASSAVARLSEVEARAVRLGYWRIAARAARLRGLDALIATRVAESQRRYEAGLELANRSGDTELSAVFHTFLAEGYGQQGDLENAWRHLAGTFTQVSRIHAARQRFEILNSASILARRSGLQHAALFFADELLDVTREWSNPEGAISGHLSRARAMADLDLGDRGVSDLDAVEGLLPALASRPQAQTRLRAELAANRAYSLAGRNDGAALEAASSAIDYFDRSVRLRLAELLLQRGRIRKRLGDPVLANADWMRAAQIVEDQRPALRTELLRVSRTAAIWDLFIELIDSARSDPHAALALVERAKARELVYSLAPDQTPDAFSLARVQSLLTGGTQAVVFSQLPERLLIWIVDATTVSMIERPVNAAHVRDLVGRFVRSLDTTSDPGASEQLADLLLPPAIIFRSDRPIVFVPDGPLHALPFAALPVPGRSRLVVQDAIPVIVPSLSAFAIAASASPMTATPHLLAVGVGDAGREAGLPALPYVERETSKVGELYARRQNTLIGEAASRAQVMSALGAAGIVHFAGHAVLDPMFPARSRLVLADGPLTPADIATAHVNPGTVVILSACDTAAGQTYRGEGPMSLVRAWLVAGASTVVATLWQVRDDDAFRLVTLVHRSLANGVGAAESLARAQRELIARHAARASWAGFAAFGSGQIRRKDS